MKTITPILSGEMYKVISEPGDATRYDYAVYQNKDDFCFMFLGNIFAYPQRLNYFKIKHFKEITNELVNLAKYHNCNPHTLLECIRTVKELF